MASGPVSISHVECVYLGEKQHDFFNNNHRLSHYFPIIGTIHKINMSVDSGARINIVAVNKRSVL